MIFHQDGIESDDEYFSFDTIRGALRDDAIRKELADGGLEYVPEESWWVLRRDDLNMLRALVKALVKWKRGLLQKTEEPRIVDNVYLPRPVPVVAKQYDGTTPLSEMIYDDTCQPCIQGWAVDDEHGRLRVRQGDWVVFGQDSSHISVYSDEDFRDAYEPEEPRRPEQ